MLQKTLMALAMIKFLGVLSLMIITIPVSKIPGFKQINAWALHQLPTD